MKRVIRLSMIMTVAFSILSAKDKHRLPEELSTVIERVIPCIEMTPKLTQELLTGQHPEIAIEFKEGTELPLKYKGNFGLFSVTYNPNLSFKVEKQCYLRLIRKKVYLSFDLKDWDKASSFKKAKVDINFGVRDKSHIAVEANLKQTELFDSNQQK